MDERLSRSLARISEILTRLRIPHAFTGGIVSARFGVPRFTHDIDVVVVFENPFSVAALITVLENEYYIDPAMVHEAVRNNSMFNAMDLKTSFTIDFHIGESIPGELSRAQMTEFAGGIVVSTLSPEDAILSKLQWIQKGSHRSRSDVIGMFKQQKNLNWAFLESMADQLNVADLLMELKREALI